MKGIFLFLAREKVVTLAGSTAGGVGPDFRECLVNREMGRRSVSSYNRSTSLVNSSTGSGCRIALWDLCILCDMSDGNIGVKVKVKAAFFLTVLPLPACLDAACLSQKAVERRPSFSRPFPPLTSDGKNDHRNEPVHEPDFHIIQIADVTHSREEGSGRNTNVRPGQFWKVGSAVHGCRCGLTLPPSKLVVDLQSYNRKNIFGQAPSCPANPPPHSFPCNRLTDHPWDSHGPPLRLSRTTPETLTDHPWDSHGPPLGLSRTTPRTHGPPLGLSRTTPETHGPPLRLSRTTPGTLTDHP
ncbi:hypothetical protein J6590_041301 [Homalodisca vitripennis]|nr:hypothetical protein J6590_041301 [Homalodisca vitripennis]